MISYHRELEFNRCGTCCFYWKGLLIPAFPSQATSAIIHGRARCDESHHISFALSMV
jgi:hypothetical protein